MLFAFCVKPAGTHCQNARRGAGRVISEGDETSTSLVVIFQVSTFQGFTQTNVSQNLTRVSILHRHDFNETISKDVSKRPPGEVIVPCGNMQYFYPDLSEASFPFNSFPCVQTRYGTPAEQLSPNS